MTTQHMLARMERMFPTKEIVTQREGSLHRCTYPKLTARIHQLAAALHRLGVKQGDRVATLVWNNYRHLEIYYAVPSMGAVLHTLNLRLSPDQLEFVIADATDSILFVDKTLLPLLNQLAGRMPSVTSIVVLSDGGPLPEHQLGETLDYEMLLAGEGGDFDWPALDERQASSICHTSGTTGRPKGVVYSHRSLFLQAMMDLQKDTVGLSERDVVLPVIPMFHVNCWALPYAAGLAGSTLVLPDRFMGDAGVLIDLADREGVTILAGVPTIWINLVRTLERSGRRLPKVHSVICGGAAIPRGLMKDMDRLGLRMVHGWGMTETMICTLSRPRSWIAPTDELDYRLRQGVSAPGVEVRIADLVTGEELPWDGMAFGEIQCRGPWVASGYLNDADPDKVTRDGWFRTGDVATMSPEGYITIVDRTKDLIKSGGEWISSVELEGTIMAHPKVLEAAVVGLSHPLWQERPVAYVVPKSEFQGQVAEDEIREFLRDRVAKWWLPDEIRFIDEIPKTSTLKFDKKALRAQAEPIHEEVSWQVLDDSLLSP